MLNIFRKLTGSRKDSSKDVAKKRLKFTLIYDKLEISEDILNDLHRDIVEVISKYFEIDKNAFNLNIHRSDELSSLTVNTPILSTKHRKKNQPA